MRFLLALCVAGFSGTENIKAQEVVGGRPSEQPAAKAPPMATPKPKPDGRVRLLLDDGSQMVGTPVDAKGITLTTRVGEVSIPLKELAIAVIAKGEDGVSKVQLKNGDVFSGKIEPTAWRIRSTWGELTVKPEHVLVVSSNVKEGKGISISFHRPVIKISSNGTPKISIVREVIQPGNKSSGVKRLSTRPMITVTPRIIIQEEEEELVGLDSLDEGSNGSRE